MWAFGPTKPLYAEAWLDSVAAATQRPLGGCDFRFDDTSPQAFTDSILVRYSFPRTPAVDPLFYATAAHSLGGCPIANAHGSPSGLVPAVTRRVALAQICPSAFTPTHGTSLEELVALEYAGLGRPPTSQESATWLAYLSDPTLGGCDPSAAACDLETLAAELCQSLFATAQFNYY
jgi:hypothetical protein